MGGGSAYTLSPYQGGRTVNIQLSEELRRFVEAKVQSRQFDSANEVVAEGLRLLAELDRIQETQLDRLHEEIDGSLDDEDDFESIRHRAAGMRDELI